MPRQPEIVEAAADRLMAALAALAAHPDIADPTIGGSLEAAFSVQVGSGLHRVVLRLVPSEDVSGAAR